MKYYTGGGLVNDAINKLPFELHVPSYKFLGPGTKLAKRLMRGDKPKNKLDEAAMEHDIFYRDHKHTKERHQADTVLAKKAMERFRSRDASLGEKLTALGVAGIMKAKVKLGMGLKPKQSVLRQCLRMLEKTKIALEMCIKNLQDGIQMLQLNEIPKKTQPFNKRRMIKKKTKQKMVKDIEINNMDVDIFDDFPIGKIKRKRNNSDSDNSPKRLKLNDNLPKIIAKRRIKEHGNLQVENSIDFPSTNNLKKRKLEIDDEDDTSIPQKVQVINSSDI